MIRRTHNEPRNRFEGEQSAGGSNIRVPFGPNHFEFVQSEYTHLKLALAVEIFS